MNEPAAPCGHLRLDEAVLMAAGLDGAERETYLSDLAASDFGLAAEARRRLAAAENLSDCFSPPLQPSDWPAPQAIPMGPTNRRRARRYRPANATSSGNAWARAAWDV